MTAAPLAPFPLAIRPAGRAVHAPAAWFVPGDDPAEWLAELGRWGVPMAELRLYVVPASPRDRRPVGVLVVTPDAQTPREVVRALPYGVVGGRLYLPLDAKLWPPVSDAELRAMLRLDAYVLHPAVGLVGFAAGESVRVHDLVEPPAPSARDARWNLAIPGPPGIPRLVAVEPETMPGLADILEDARDDIGSDRPDLLPPAEDESKLADIGKRIALPPLNFLSKLLGGGGAVGRWAAEKAARFSKSLNDARFRELERLRKLLEKEPDEGLRHAIPLRDIAGRGRSAPGARLVRHDVGFNLSSLFGGGSGGTDSWYVPPDMVQILTQRYREAANRELRLGRYRRAAYIFAELLGDFSSAANALEQGRFFREAAVLYRDQLKNPRKAAECLEAGGLLPEAITLYVQLGMYEKAGDLHMRLEQFEEADFAYRTQVNFHLTHQQILAAAKLLETKMLASEEALKVLSDAWPGGDASGECLKESFALLARLARHDDAVARIDKLRGNTPPAGKGVVLTQVLSHISTSYPHDPVRTLGADATRVVAGMVLPDVEHADRQPIARAVGRLAPGDRLLARDVERFLARPRMRQRPAARQTLRAPGDPVVVRQLRLPGDAAWKTVAVDGATFYALGAVSPGLYMLRGNWQGLTQGGYWKIDARWGDAVRFQLHPVPHHNRVAIIPAIIEPKPQTFPRTDTFSSDINFDAGAWLRAIPTLALAYDETAYAWVLAQAPDGFTLSAHRSDTGALLASHSLTNMLSPLAAGTPIELAVRKNRVVGTWGEAGVFVHRHDVMFRMISTPSPARTVVATIIRDQACFAVGLQDGAMFIDGEGDGHPFADGLTAPHVAFTRGGLLIAVDALEGRVYDVRGGAPTRRAGFGVPPGGDVIAVTSTDHLHGFAVFTADGNVHVYQAPA